MSKGRVLAPASTLDVVPRLCTAAFDGNVPDLQAALRDGVNINRQQKDNSRTALHQACLKGHEECVAILLDQKGINLELEAGGKNTALHLACQQGYLGIIRRLIDKGANVKTLKADSSSVLSVVCVSQGSVEVVQLIIDKFKELNCLEEFINKRQDTSVIRDPRFAKNHGRTPLHLAALSSLCPEADPANAAVIVELLLANGANPNNLDYDGSTPLHMACQRGDVRVVNALLRYGAKRNLTSTAEGRVALHEAAFPGHSAVLLALLEDRRGKEDNIHQTQLDDRPHIDAAQWGPQGNGRTALHEAALEGRREVVELLLEFGATVDLSEAEGYTPLHMAASNGHAKVVDVLLDNGADPAACTNGDGLCPLHWAVVKGHIDTVSVMLGHKTPPQLQLEMEPSSSGGEAATATAGGSASPCATLTKSTKKGKRLPPVDVNLRQKDYRTGHTPLHLASGVKNGVDMWNLLLDHGADALMTDKMNGRTPIDTAAEHNPKYLDVTLIWAYSKSNVVLIEKLLAKGARPAPHPSVPPMVAPKEMKMPNAEALRQLKMLGMMGP